MTTEDYEARANYLLERRKIVRTDEFVYYGAMGLLYALDMPKRLLLPIVAAGAWFVLRGYQYTDKLERELNEFADREEIRNISKKDKLEEMLDKENDSKLKILSRGFNETYFS